MTSQRFFLLFTAAGLSAGLFIAAALGGGGLLTFFAPALPLFYYGFQAPSLALYAAVMASLAITAAAGVPIGILFALFFALPAWYFTYTVMSTRGDKQGAEWFPVGRALLRMTLYATAAGALLAFFSTSQGGIEAAMMAQLQEAMADMEADYAVTVQNAAQDWLFVVYALGLWLWVLLLYAHAWAAHKLAVIRAKTLRLSLHLAPFAMPNWMLSLLAIGALASLIGSPPMMFAGKSALLSLLLPYFLLGMSLLHAWSRQAEGRRIYLFFIYLMIFSLLWPVMLVAAFGLWHHIKRLSAGAISIK